MRFVVWKINANTVDKQFENIFDGVIDLIWFIVCPQNGSNQWTLLTVKNSIARFFNISEMHTKDKRDSYDLGSFCW